MNLTRAERWTLSNQMRMLEALYPKEASSITHERRAIEEGYELHYSDAAQHIHEDVMSSEGCLEVLNILSMFRAIYFSLQALPDRDGVEQWQTRFNGFDGNNEPKQMRYAEWYCLEGGNFAELHPKEGFNSHSPTLEVYRRMLEEWNRSKDKHHLTKEDIVQVGRARLHPDNR